MFPRKLIEKLSLPTLCSLIRPQNPVQRPWQVLPVFSCHCQILPRRNLSLSFSWSRKKHSLML